MRQAVDFTQIVTIILNDGTELPITIAELSAVAIKDGDSSLVPEIVENGYATRGSVAYELNKR